MSGRLIHFNKTRIAPTPSGFLHLGNVLSFTLTTALARLHRAKVLLRIDDIDQTRADEKYIQDIFDTLNFLEIPWDEGPHNAGEFKDSYSQMHRLPLYREVIEQLKDSGLVFACTCSRKQLEKAPCTCFDREIPLDTKEAAWRLHTYKARELSIRSYNDQTVTAVLPADMQNFVIRKKDAFPAYQLTSVIDDLHYGVDLIIRGQDLWSSTLAQHELALALGKSEFQDITFYHHPLLTDELNQKLSKSAGATSVLYLRQSGKTPAQIYTMIANMLGLNMIINNWEQLAEIVLTFYKNNPAPAINGAGLHK
ncbi:tRNA glutamyl-Q synthetase [Mucilaginibacter sp. HC2]|uniref:glutamate--tRNA ligase family protein n=1 Tax=Mucilaginibacter inviolabilis TaxID=2714892 RepID=UPI001407CEA8|nr:glutamate--tRNA ligase family protein [Mucilaginibacter inviolabilis]NHA04332.1 tRNA glutamyl-Q synthetase [Mucilaginibacter inviolabilis]